MKKRFISLCLTLALTAATAGAAFSDISSGSLQQTASVLGSLGIMQGTGNNRFEPNRPLTRAEFCKLAVTAMGIDDASPYASYTIFPDGAPRTGRHDTSMRRSATRTSRTTTSSAAMPTAHSVRTDS